MTFAENRIEKIELVSSLETAHVGDIVYDILPDKIIAANGIAKDN